VRASPVARSAKILLQRRIVDAASAGATTLLRQIINVAPSLPLKN
jgi:hypothetical protein